MTARATRCSPLLYVDFQQQNIQCHCTCKLWRFRSLSRVATAALLQQLANDSSAVSTNCCDSNQCRLLGFGTDSSAMNKHIPVQQLSDYV